MGREKKPILALKILFYVTKAWGHAVSVQPDG